MFIQVTNVVKQRLIRELKSRIIEHPDFKEVLIANKMPEQDLPNAAIIIAGASGSQKKLDLSDHVTRVYNRASLARTVEGPSTSIEWVVDNENVPPDDVVTPGFYFTKVLTVPTYNAQGTYEINQVYRRIERFSPTLTSAQLSYLPLNNKIYVYTEFDGRKRRDLVSPAQFVYDSNTNEIVLTDPMEHETLVVSYFEAAMTIPNIPCSRNSVDVSSLPGIVIAFGERIIEGDQQVIAVSHHENKACYDVQGGQWQISLDIACYAQDPGLQERLIDYVSVWLWERRVELERDHIIITDISLGGETTDLEVSISKVPYFQATLSLEIITNWEVHIPVIFSWRKIDIYDFSEDDGTSTDEEIVDIETKFIPVLDISKEQQFVPDYRMRMIRPGFLAL